MVYLGDIVVYSNTLEEHAEHLRIMFRVLRDNELYAKWDKCLVDFLSHKIIDGTLLMDKA